MTAKCFQLQQVVVLLLIENPKREYVMSYMYVPVAEIVAIHCFEKFQVDELYLLIDSSNYELVDYIVMVHSLI